MNKNYLLTYQITDINDITSTSFDWFDTLEEMKEFIDDNPNIIVMGRLHIIQAEEVNKNSNKDIFKKYIEHMSKYPMGGKMNGFLGMFDY